MKGNLPIPIFYFKINQFKIGFHIKTDARIFREKHFQGIGRMGIHGNDFSDTLLLKFFGDKFGMLDEAVQIAQIVEKDPTVIIQFGPVKEIHP